MSSFSILFLSCSGACEGGVKNCRISLKLVRWPYLNFWYVLEQSFNSHICEFRKNSMGRFFVVAISLYLKTTRYVLPLNINNFVLSYVVWCHLMFIPWLRPNMFGTIPKYVSKTLFSGCITDATMFWLHTT